MPAKQIRAKHERKRDSCSKPKKLGSSPGRTNGKSPANALSKEITGIGLPAANMDGHMSKMNNSQQIEAQVGRTARRKHSRRSDDEFGDKMVHARSISTAKPIIGENGGVAMALVPIVSHRASKRRRVKKVEAKGQVCDETLLLDLIDTSTSPHPIPSHPILPSPSPQLSRCIVLYGGIGSGKDHRSKQLVRELGKKTVTIWGGNTSYKQFSSKLQAALEERQNVIYFAAGKDVQTASARRKFFDLLSEYTTTHTIEIRQSITPLFLCYFTGMKGQLQNSGPRQDVQLHDPLVFAKVFKATTPIAAEELTSYSFHDMVEWNLEEALEKSDLLELLKLAAGHLASDSKMGAINDWKVSYAITKMASKLTEESLAKLDKGRALALLKDLWQEIVCNDAKSRWGQV
jgi:hypothetical protein